MFEGERAEAEIDGLEGSPEAKLRTKTVIRVLIGEILPEEACRLLEVDEAELKQFRLMLAESVMQAVIRPDPKQN